MTFQGSNVPFHEVKRPATLTSTEIIKILNLLPTNNEVVSQAINTTGIKKPYKYAAIPVKTFTIEVSGDEIITSGIAFRIPMSLYDKPKHQLEVYDGAMYILNKDFDIVKGSNGDALLILPDKTSIAGDLTVVFNPATRGILSVAPLNPVVLTKSDSRLFREFSLLQLIDGGVTAKNAVYTEAATQFVITPDPVKFIDILLSDKCVCTEISNTVKYSVSEVYASPIINNTTGISLLADYQDGNTNIILNSIVSSVRLYDKLPKDLVSTDLQDIAYSLTTALTNISEDGNTLKRLLNFPESKQRILNKLCKNDLFDSGDKIFKPCKKFISPGVFVDGFVAGPYAEDSKLLIIKDGQVLISERYHGYTEMVNGNLTLIPWDSVTSYEFITIPYHPNKLLFKLVENTSAISSFTSNRDDLSIVCDETIGYYGLSKYVEPRWKSMVLSTFIKSVNLNELCVSFTFEKGFDTSAPQIIELLANFNIPYIYNIESFDAVTSNTRIYTKPLIPTDTVNIINNLQLIKSDKFRLITDRHIKALTIFLLPIHNIISVPLVSQSKLSDYILELDDFIPSLDCLIINGMIISPLKITESLNKYYVIWDFPEVIKDIRIIKSLSDSRFMAGVINKIYREDIQRGYTKTLGTFSNKNVSIQDIPFTPPIIPEWSVKGAFDVLMQDYVLNGRLKNIAKAADPTEVANTKQDIINKFPMLSAEAVLGYDGKNKQRIVIKSNKDLSHCGYRT